MATFSSPAAMRSSNCDIIGTTRAALRIVSRPKKTPVSDAFAIDTVGEAGHGSVVRASHDPGHVLEYSPFSDYCNTDPGGSPDTFTYAVTGGAIATVSITVTCQSGDALFASGFE